MPSIVTNPFRVFSVDKFLQTHKELKQPLYFTIHKKDPWDNGGIPPNMNNTDKERSDALDSLIAMQRIPDEDLFPVIKNYRWKSGLTDFVQFDDNNDSAIYTKFYCVNSEGRVYTCVKKGSEAVSVEPKGHNNGNVITGADGYEWKYYYIAKGDEFAKFKDHIWFPIHFGNYATPEQVQYGSRFVNIAFGANYVMAQCRITDEGIPIHIDYHQIGLISNPHDMAQKSMTTFQPDPKQLDKDWSDLVYLENMYKVQRKIGKHETYQIILEF